MRYFKSIFYKACVLLLLLVCSILFLIGTTPGTHVAVTLAGLALPGHLQLSKTSGTLFQGLMFHELVYSDAKIKIHLQEANISWNINPPGQLTVIVNHPHIQSLQIETPASTPNPHKEPTPFKLPSIPVAIKINEGVIDKLIVNDIALDNIFLQAFVTPTGLDIAALAFDYGNQHIAGLATGQFQSPYAITSALHISPLSSTKDNLAGDIHVTGDKNCYTWEGTLKGILPITFSGTLLHLTDLKTELFLAQNKMTFSGTIPINLS